METDAGIGVLSMMITVITFLTGFFLMYGGRVLGDVSGMLGYLRGVGDRIRRSDSGKEFLAKLEKNIKEGVRDRRWMEVGIGLVFASSMGVVVYLLTVLQQVGHDGWEGLFWFYWFLFITSIVFLSGVLGSLMVVSGRFAELSRQREASHG